MKTPPPTLGDLFALKTVEGIAFWCSNHACLHHDSAPVSVVAIDYGAGDDFAGHGALQLLPGVLRPCAGAACLGGYAYGFGEVMGGERGFQPAALITRSLFWR